MGTAGEFILWLQSTFLFKEYMEAALPAIKISEIFFAQSNFTIQQNLLQRINEEPVPRVELHPGWLFPLLVIVIASIGFMRMVHGRSFNLLIQSVFNNNLANQLIRDDNVLVQRANFLFSIMFSLVAALVLYQASIAFGWKLAGIGPGFLRYAFLAVLVSGIYTFKFIIIKMTGLVFNQGREFTAYVFNIFLVNFLLSLLLTPIIVFIGFSDLIPARVLIFIAAALFASAFLFRIGRGILIGLRSQGGFSPVYLFLYLCALEIAPLLVLIKVIAQQ